MLAAQCVAHLSAQETQRQANSNLEAYRAHLGQLLVIVADCQQQHTAEACDPSRVGPDESVKLVTQRGSTERKIRYDWLRNLLAQASSNKEQTSVPTISGAPIAVQKSQPIEVQLRAAQERLAEEAKLIPLDRIPAQEFQSEHQVLGSILANKEYKSVSRTTLRERITAWILKWIDRIFDKLVGAGAHLPWLARILRDLFFAGICLLLVGMLLRAERRSRIRLPGDMGIGDNVPSAREWQSWLQDARKMAEECEWRQAIHFLYWAVISRLESRNVWPADRARTPREYLRLVPGNDSRKEHLRSLTGTFENTWYGGRSANANDYNDALRVAEELGVK
jgi:hypothetical protein